MSIYSRDAVEKSAKAAAAEYLQGQDAVCPFPDSHPAAAVWRAALNAEFHRLHLLEVA